MDAYPDRTFPARITQVRYGSQTVDGVVTYETVLKVDNTDLSLRPGMTATADITVTEGRQRPAGAQCGPALLAPRAGTEEPTLPRAGRARCCRGRPASNAAQAAGEVDTNKKQQKVWALKDGQPTAVPVTIGSTDGTMTEIVSRRSSRACR